MTKPLDDNLLALTLLVTIALQVTCFFISWVLQFDKMYVGQTQQALSLSVAPAYVLNPVAGTDAGFVYCCSFDSTDLSGSMNFVLIAWLTFWTTGTYHPRQIVVLALVTVWGMRLGGFLLYRVLLRGKDDRFDEMRAHFFQFLGFWVSSERHTQMRCARRVLVGLMVTWYCCVFAPCLLRSDRANHLGQ